MGVRFGIGCGSYRYFLREKKKHDNNRSRALHYFLASHIQATVVPPPFDMNRIDARDIHSLDEFIGELVEEHTDLAVTAFEKLNKLERLPFLETTYLAISKRQSNNPGGRPTSVDVKKRRVLVQTMLAEGKKPGEIAYQLRVDPNVIYQDLRRLKI